MKPIDTLLWSLVARPNHYFVALAIAWLSVLPMVRIALMLEAFSGGVLLATGLPTIVVIMATLADSRARFVRWRRWAGLAP
jgi:hypothetical protein